MNRHNAILKFKINFGIQVKAELPICFTKSHVVIILDNINLKNQRFLGQRNVKFTPKLTIKLFLSEKVLTHVWLTYPFYPK